MNLWSLLVNSRIWPTDVLNRCLNMLLMDVDIRGLATAAFGYRDFRFRFLVQNLELTVSSLYQVYNRVFTSICISMNLVSKWPVCHHCHSIRLEVGIIKFHEVSDFWNCHEVRPIHCGLRGQNGRCGHLGTQWLRPVVTSGRCYRNCFFPQIVFCWKHCSQMPTKVANQ